MGTPFDDVAARNLMKSNRWNQIHAIFVVSMPYSLRISSLDIVRASLSVVVDMMCAMSSRSLQFASAAKLLTQAARDKGLEPPAFRSPPRVLGRDRTLRRTRDGAVVSVQLNGRPLVAVVADMIEGTLAANALDDVDAEHARRSLWEAVEAQFGDAVSRAA
jgi:hypothetical protein